VLDGTYPNDTSSSLWSPWTTVPPAQDNPRLRFWHWFSIHAGGGSSGYCFQGNDLARVYVRGTNGVAEPISPDYYWNSDWTRASLDLSKYAGQRVQFLFYFYANCAAAYAGWFIDDVEVVSGPYQMANPEGFENGLGDWAADRGNWQVGHPIGGPGRAHSGNQCAAVVLDGTYFNDTSSSLVSPWFTVPPSNQIPQLKFWHWVSIHGGGGSSGYCFQPADYAQVLVRGTNGATEALSVAYGGSSGWTQASLPLDKYSGQPVQLLFYFYANCNVGTAGWFIDDICVEAAETMAFNVIGNRTSNEETLISFPVSVRGTNVNSCVRYSLGPGAPEGATIDPITGRFNWTPVECQGPYLYWIPIIARDACASNAIVCAYPQIDIKEVNKPPLLLEPNRTLEAEANAAWALCGTDDDCPANSLTYLLLSGPAGLTVSPEGRVSWIPTLAQLGSNSVTVKVTDDSPDAVNAKQLSTTNRFTVIVVTNLPHFTLQIRRVSGGNFQFTIANGPVGSNYVLQCAPFLMECPPPGHWQDIMSVQPVAMPHTFNYTDPLFGVTTNRFYRLRTP